MKIKNFELVSYLNILNSYDSKKLPHKIVFAIVKNISLLMEEYKVYESTLKKIQTSYDKYFKKNKDGENALNESHLPFVDSESYPEQAKEYYQELSDLLNIEIEINLYKIDDSVFDYDDNKYDILTAKDMITLQTILCK